MRKPEPVETVLGGYTATVIGACAIAMGHGWFGLLMIVSGIITIVIGIRNASK